MATALEPSDPFGAIIDENDLWLTQKKISTILASSVKNVNDIIRDLERSGYGSEPRLFTIINKEGARDIRRDIKHYRFEIIHAIAIRTNRLDKLAGLVEFARARGVLKSTYCVPTRKELRFKEIITILLKDITALQNQFPIAGFLVDFYLPELNVVLEFDEGHHEKIGNAAKDKVRQQIIEAALGATFIRVAHGDEWNGLNQVVRAILAAK